MKLSELFQPENRGLRERMLREEARRDNEQQLRQHLDEEGVPHSLLGDEATCPACRLEGLAADQQQAYIDGAYGADVKAYLATHGIAEES